MEAGLLMEVGQLREAELLLQNILKLVKRNILTSEFSELLFSVRSTIELFLWRMDWTRSVDLKNLESIMRDCRDMIVEAERYPSRLETTHGFNLLSIGQSLHFGGGGFEGDFYGAVRFFRLYEKFRTSLWYAHRFFDRSRDQDVYDRAFITLLPQLRVAVDR